MTLEKDMRQILVDERCLDLARQFLQDEKCRTAGDDLRLAEVFQRAMEDWFDARNCPHSLAGDKANE